MQCNQIGATLWHFAANVVSTCRQPMAFAQSAGRLPSQGVLHYKFLKTRLIRSERAENGFG
jgi:hypothetical protein